VALLVADLLTRRLQRVTGQLQEQGDLAFSCLFDDYPIVTSAFRDAHA